MADKSNKDVSTVIVAGSGLFAVDPDAGSIILSLRNGRIYSKDRQRLNVLSFNDYNVRMSLDSIFKGIELGEKKPKEMSVPQLQACLSDPALADKDGGGYLRKVAVEIQKRVAQPIGCLALGLFALPWACIFRGLRQHYGIIIVLSLFFLYFSMMSMGISLAEAGSISPVWALWTPNFLFLAASAYGIRLASRERNVRLVSFFAHLRLLRRKKGK